MFIGEEEARQMQTQIARRLRGFRSDLHELRQMAAELPRTVRARDLATGRWFWAVVTSYLVHHPARRRRLQLGDVPDAERSKRAADLVREAAMLTAMTGGGAGVASTTASVTTADTGGLAAPVAIPAAGIAVGADMLLRSLVQLRLTCDLADLYGIELGPGSERELASLHALALGLYDHEEKEDPGRELVERLVVLRMGEPSGGLGSRLLSESLLRNLVPYLGVFTSSVASWRLTRSVGRFVQDYARHRRAIDEVAHRIDQRWPEHRDLLVEGLWFVFIADGRLTPTEAALLAHLVHTEPEQARKAILERFVVDEAAWLARLREVEDDELRRSLMDALQAAAAADTVLPASEWSVLRGAAEALHLEVDVEQVEDRLQRSA